MLQFWLSGGAPGPEEGTLQGTEDAIAGCFPDPVPIQIRPLEAPAEGEGVQLEMPPYVLPASSEVEICFCSYVDMRDQIPAEFMTPDGKFFAYDQSEIRQTGASHHMLFFAPNSRLLGEDFDPNTFSDWTCAGGGERRRGLRSPFRRLRRGLLCDAT